MENEEEGISKLQNPVVQVEQDSINRTTGVAVTAMDSHEQGQRGTEPQCEPELGTGLSEPVVLHQEQSLAEGKRVDDDSMVGEQEAVAESSDSKLAGGGGDVSCDSQFLITEDVGEENEESIDGGEKRGVINAVDVTNGGEFVQLVSVVGGGGNDDDMIAKEEREAADGAEETKDRALVADVRIEEEKADVAEELEDADESKVVDLTRDSEEKTGMKGTDIEDEENGSGVAVETEIEGETKAVKVAEKTEIRDDVTGQMDESAEMAEDEDIAGEMQVVDAAEEKETANETKAVDIAEDTETADETKTVGIAEETETADETKAVGIAEETETANETKAVALAEEMDERAAMEEDREIGGEIKVFDTADGNEIVKESDVADFAKEKESAEDGKVAVLTETTTADEVDVGDVAEETEMQDYETEFADVVGGETGLVEEMEDEHEMLEATETEAEMGMGDLGEEAMEAATEMGYENDKVDMVEEMEVGEEVEEVSKTVGGKRKRGGKNSKSPGRVPPRKKSEEDVCFICFDGGDLVLCDRRGCPKAYHPACVNRDEAFFRAKGRWNCGWHLCSICEKNAHYMCYTCTFSLCKMCIKDTVILCVRGNKGFCETCMKTVMLIERSEEGNEDTGQVDFDDKNSWEYLFKDYWLDLKRRLSLSSDELAHAKNPWKGSEIQSGKEDSPDELYDINIDGGQGSDGSSGNAEATVSKRRKTKKRSKSRAKEGDRRVGGERMSIDEGAEWASKELLELVMHMRNGDKSVLSQFDVQTLLLEYIKKYKLRDPQRRTHVICDSRLQNLFGKPRVGHFEMLKLLESHFLTREDSQVDELQESVVDTDANQLEADGNSDGLIKVGKDKKRKTRKKGDDRGLQSNLDDYAAIDMHNINLIYLRRNLVEELLEDTETFHAKVVGCFARIRISGSVQKQDLYRLVQVVGTSKVAEPYKVGKRMTDILLEILNLNKTEVISIDIVSNQEFTEDECKRLRQSIKCGLINSLTVGDIQEKALALQAVRVKDWMEAEIMRLSHLRDRASDLGRRKELRECVEKLQLLKTPEERQRRLDEIPEIHSDPNMDPSYESEEDDGDTDDKRQENYLRPRGSSFSRRGREPISPGKGGSFSNDSFSGSRNYLGGNKELSRNMSNKGFLSKGDDFVGVSEMVNENLWNQARDKEMQQLRSSEKPRIASNLETGGRNPHSVVLSESISKVVSENSPSTGVTQFTAKVNESEKIWHYKDPSGKIQGPFSMMQLRKWSNTGYFPAQLRIWRSTEKQDDSILLTDALNGKFHKDPPLVDVSLSHTVSYFGKPHGAPLQQGIEVQVGGNSNFDQNHTAWNAHGALGSSGLSVGGNWKLKPEISSTDGSASLQSRDGWSSETNLPSPTPTQSTAVETRGKTFEKEWSPTPIKQSGSLMIADLSPGGNAGQQSPAAIVSESSQLTHFSTPSSTSKSSGSADGLNVTHTLISASKSETGELHRMLVTPHQLSSSDSVATSMNPSVDMKSTSASFQSLVQPVSAHIPPVETHGWGSGLTARPETVAPSPKHGSGSQIWGNASSQKLELNNPVSMPAQSPAYAQPYASSFSTGSSSVVFPASGQSGMPPSDSWRTPAPIQSNIQPPAQPVTPWGMGITGNQNAMPRQGTENQNTGWGPMPGNPSMGWGGQLPASTNMNWGGPVQGAPGNANSGWAGPGQGQAPKNAIPGWVPSGQGPSLVNANSGWIVPGQGLPSGPQSPGWVPPTGNPGMWGSEQNNSGDRFLSQRDQGSQGGDPGYGAGGRHWNRQSSFGSRGGDLSRPPYHKGQRVCKFHESGHCKKGAQCDYLHT